MSAYVDDTVAFFRFKTIYDFLFMSRDYYKIFPVERTTYLEAIFRNIEGESDILFNSCNRVIRYRKFGKLKSFFSQSSSRFFFPRKILNIALAVKYSNLVDSKIILSNTPAPLVLKSHQALLPTPMLFEGRYIRTKELLKAILN